MPLLDELFDELLRLELLPLLELLRPDDELPDDELREEDLPIELLDRLPELLDLAGAERRTDELLFLLDDFVLRPLERLAEREELVVPELPDERLIADVLFFDDDELVDPRDTREDRDWLPDRVLFRLTDDFAAACFALLDVVDLLLDVDLPTVPFELRLELLRLVDPERTVPELRLVPRLVRSTLVRFEAVARVELPLLSDELPRTADEVLVLPLSRCVRDPTLVVTLLSLLANVSLVFLLVLLSTFVDLPRELLPVPREVVA